MMDWTLLNHRFRKDFRNGAANGRTSWVLVLLHFDCTVLSIVCVQTLIAVVRHRLSYSASIENVRVVAATSIVMACLLIYLLRQPKIDRYRALLPAILGCSLAAIVWLLCLSTSA